MVRTKDHILSLIPLKIKTEICDDQVVSVLKDRLTRVNSSSNITVIICSTRKEVDAINSECLKLIYGCKHKFVAVDTDSNGKRSRPTTIAAY